MTQNQDENRQIIDFFKTVNKGLKKYGIRKVVRMLAHLEIEENNIYFNEINECIISEVVRHYGITRQELFEFGRGEITDARKITIVLIKTHLDVTDSELGAYLNRVRQVVYKAVKEFKEMERDDKFNKQFFEAYDAINHKVVERIALIKGDVDGG